jgi:hypothetical protein
MIGCAKLFQDRAMPETWHVERENEDGAIEVAIFSGPDARERAVVYARSMYRDFDEIRLAP